MTRLQKSYGMTTVLINFPTNIGDCIISLFALDRIRSNFPQASITAIASPGTREFLQRNTFIDAVVVFDKFWKPLEKLRFLGRMRGKFEVIIDFKNSMLPFLLGATKRTPFVRRFSNKVHIVEKYTLILDILAPMAARVRCDFRLDDQERDKWRGLGLDKALFIACTSLSHIKQYPPRHLERVVTLLDGRYPIVILGKDNEAGFYSAIRMRKEVIDLVGKTTMWEIFYLLKNHAAAVLGVDSSITHMAGYLGIPVVALFGPTSFERSYPRSEGSVVLRRQELECLPCEKPGCSRGNECMNIDPGKVVSALLVVLSRTIAG